MGVDLIVEDERWDAARLAVLAERACGGALAHLNVVGGEVSLMACDDARIAELNAAFRDKSVATNVLSWPSEERGAVVAGGVPAAPVDLELGDIAISYDTCLREAVRDGKDFESHLCHLLVHATLHLLGYDHIDDKDAALMEGLEVEILGNLGVSDPYGDAGA